MKKDKLREMREEYHREELGTGVRGKYYDSYRNGTNVVLLDPDVAKAFPTQESVNRALRSLITKASRVRPRRKTQKAHNHVK